MSGICGAWDRANPARIPESLARFTKGLSLSELENVRQRNEGPAGIGASARFATQQVYESSRILIACDADLQNEDELRASVQDAELVPADAKVAALLAGLYERFGYDFVSRLRGAFSLILWDHKRRTFMAAVDGFGIKRLAYYYDEALLLVGSRVDALARCCEIDTRINPRAIANLLQFSADLAPHTVFSKIHRLGPGERLVAVEGRLEVKNYWDMRYEPATDRHEKDLCRELESAVERAVAVECRGESDSELGAYLSGGTDSSTVVGMMSRVQRGPVKAFSIGFREQHFNELGYAEIAAKKFGAKHFEYLVDAADCLAALPDMIRCFDEPFGNSSAIPTYFCASLAAQNGIKVLLAGDGGDELFGGNERYSADKVFDVYGTVPRFLRKGFIEPLADWFPMRGGIAGKGRNYVKRANIPRLQRFFSYHFLSAHSPREVFSGEFLESLGGYSVLDVPARHYNEAPARDHLNKLLYLDLKITLADNDLPKVNCMSELAGIQTRFPFLDRSVTELSGRIPAELKVKGFKKRYLFKRAFRDLLPIEVLEKKKHGFGIPVATWLKSDARMRELTRDALLSSRSLERGYFQREFIEGLFRKHESEDSSYYGDTLWTLLALELWHCRLADLAVGRAA